MKRASTLILVAALAFAAIIGLVKLTHRPAHTPPASHAQTPPPRQPPLNELNAPHTSPMIPHPARTPTPHSTLNRPCILHLAAHVFEPYNPVRGLTICR